MDKALERSREIRVFLSLLLTAHMDPFPDRPNGATSGSA